VETTRTGGQFLRHDHGRQPLPGVEELLLLVPELRREQVVRSEARDGLHHVGDPLLGGAYLGIQ